MKKEKKQFPYNAKTTIGVSGVTFMNIIASAFMSSYFLLYLTDYADLGVLGATIAPIILLIGRVVDAVNDPLQGWIMDRAKPRKFGKYRFFTLISLILSAISICLLYSIPSGIKSNVVLLFVWVLFFYLIYDIGASFFAVTPIIQTFGSNHVHRSKLMMYQRLLAVFIGAVFSMFLMMVNAVNARVGNFGKSFSIMTFIVCAVAFVISVSCLMLFKEGGNHEEEAKSQENSKVGLKDFKEVFTKNKAFLVHFIGQISRGMVFALSGVAGLYFVKWAYCADLATGTVDAKKFAAYSAIAAISSMLPMMVSAMISPLLAKKLGSSVKLLNLGCYITFVATLVLFVLQILGILTMSYWIYFAIIFIYSFGNGLCFVPAQTMWMECIDYNKHISGKGMGGVISTLSTFLGKAQAAIGTLITGLVLGAVGYIVDSTTGNYAGDVSRIPSMLTWFMVASGLIPAIFSALTVIVYRFYPANVVKEMEQANKLTM
jgi:Na+/melibiose symporter-like transporter